MKDCTQAVRELRLSPVEKGYTRGGCHSEKNWRAINAADHADTNAAEPFYIKEEFGRDNDRRAFFTFDVSSLADFPFKRVFFYPSFAFIAEPNTTFDMRRVNATAWRTDTLTRANEPALGELIAVGQIKQLCPVDITHAVSEALASGDPLLSFALVVSAKSERNEINSKTTVLAATTGDRMGVFTHELAEDEEENNAIWRYAEKLFDEWHERYLAIKDKPLPTVAKIESDPDEWTKTVYSAGTGFGNWTLDNVNIPYPTRTMEALDDLGDYSDYGAEQRFDEFGGLMDESRRQDATGFFYSKKIGDRWWLIDPKGYPCHIRALYGPYMNIFDSPRQKQAAIDRFGSEEGWRVGTRDLLKGELGFNTVTHQDGFSELDDRMLIQKGLVGFAKAYGIHKKLDLRLGGSTLFTQNNTMPIMEPEFEAFCNERAKAAEAERDNPWLIGYTTDNELPMDPIMLGNYLTIDPANPKNRYSYAAAWTWLRRMTGKDAPSGDDITPELQDLFRGFVWDRYFNVVTKAVKKYDPNHMLLGTRFLHTVAESEWVCRVTAEYMDCITINWYGQWEIDADKLQKICQAVDLPMIITEFYTKAMENHGSFNHPNEPLKNTKGAGWIVRTQQDRGDFYENFTLRLLECKSMVGWQWHMYSDDDTSPETIFHEDGKTYKDQSNIDANKGIVDNWHRPYPELCASMKRINQNVYRLIDHFDAKYKK
jgi:hypothetical protein